LILAIPSDGFFVSDVRGFHRDRFRRAALAASLPSATRVFLGSRFNVCRRLAAAAAFLTFLLAACLCFSEAIALLSILVLLKNPNALNPASLHC
jgi:hypothetical protein